MKILIIKITLGLTLSLFPISVIAQSNANKQYKSSNLKVLNLNRLTKQEGINPTLVVKKSIRNKNSKKDSFDLPIPKNAHRKVFDITIPKNINRKKNEDAPNSPLPSENFLGLDDNNVTGPPDTHGAVGPNHIVVALNTQLRITDKSGNEISTVSLQSFWSPLSSFVFDPKIYYDIYENRWLIVTATDGIANSSGFLIAASQTDDPTGNWNMYKIDADLNNTQWFDFPGLGFNKDWVVITGNMFELNNSGLPSSNKLFVFSKDDLYNGLPTLNINSFDNISFSFNTVTPAIMYDSSINRIYMLQNWNGLAGFYRLSKIEGTTTPTFSEVGFIGTGITWASFVQTDFAPQLGTTTKINNGGGRILDAVYRSETGTIYACHNAYLPTNSASRTVVQWLELDPDSNNDNLDGDFVLNQLGRIDGIGQGVNGNDIFYAYPSIAVNNVGDMVIGFTAFSENQYASAGYAVREANDPIGIVQSPVIFKNGLGPYFKTFGGGLNRWGDYSATSVDTDDTNIWTLQEFADTQVGSGDGSGRWGVQWAKIDFDNPLSSNELTNNTLLNSIKIYPNPSQERLNVSFESINENINLKLIDTNGRVIENKVLKDTKETSFDLINLSAGVYFLNIEVGEISVSKKIIFY